LVETQEIALQLGILFLAAIVFGRIARYIGVPRVAGYLVCGLILGPHQLGWFKPDVMKILKPATEFALALIIFEIGTKFELSRLKRQGKLLVSLVLADVLITFFLVFIFVFILRGDFTLALILGILAIATAPAATMLVLKEFSAEGQVTDSIISLIGINNIICIIAFETAVAALTSGGDFFNLAADIGMNFAELGFAILIGISSGLILTYLEQKSTGADRFILFLGAVVVVFGISYYLNISYMLVFLTMGIALVNSSEFTEEILGELDKVGYPLYILFFLMAGAKLQLISLRDIGALGILYLMARALGKTGGIYFVSKRLKTVPANFERLGMGLLTQAGLAVGLAMISVQKLGVTGVEIEVVIVSTIMIFEIVGSVLVKTTVVKAGEVKVSRLLDRPMTNPYSLSLRTAAKKFLTQLGVGPWESPKHLENLLVEHVMLKNIKTIPVDAKFEEIMSTISHSRFNNIPVTAQENHFEGVISYSELREILYDPELSTIMIAKDLARLKEWRVSPKMNLAEALEAFHNTDMDVLPVVEDRSEKFVGLLEQREVLRLVGKKNRSSVS